MAGPARPLLAIASLVLVAAGLLFQFLTILTGGVNKSPLDRFYFLEASTNGIPNARNPSRWTFFAICGENPSNGRNANCGSPVPALPFDPPRNFGTEQNIPDAFLGTKHRLGGYLSSLMTSIALFFQALAAALMTAWVVKGRDGFRSAGFEARIGRYLMGFTWAAVACFFLATVMFCLGGHLGGDSSSRMRRNRSTKSTRSRGSFLDTDSQRRVKSDYSV
ncbi:hypothetical protein COCC4DRAFT_68212 [Bipolaris maydis ATCC 48331]|uniref:Uncharacterized protein n=1 Tax=Cochliobolus heterostrophus (strain C4 / ATCC 48331 / race T) TaxID=665024 RepID=N4XX86_COCH4|nr:uncharacterized protein COCC4DRAFT_68212 [Bipolaris maydis ATCC 48331]ENI09807.1 hypothetical protein COCC4DRAFT_68212 [Bipolaris maydis ATCC 48331]KAJ5063933.1 hypothetical protein J3E74DRAFT_286609 [Bipolaris maydis]KAJ6269557.1 hypothetical protein PSV08DRAFT_248463 [Bipolaris maydis]